MDTEKSELKWRNSSLKDLDGIYKILCKQDAFKMFGLFNISHLILKSSYSYVMANEKLQIYGFISIDTQPNIMSISQYWEEWIHNLYNLKDVMYENTMFLNFICWDQCISIDFVMKSFLFDFFLNNPLLNFLIEIIPSNTDVIGVYKEHLNCIEKVEQYFPKFFTKISKVLSLLIMKRSNYIPDVIIRRAV